MFMPLAAALLSSNLAMTVADQIPQLNVEPSCRAAAATNVVRGRTMENCKKDEQTAREQIDRQWTQFTEIDKAQCVQLATMGGEPSYVELLTCLEMARDAKKLPDHNKNTLSGQASTGQASTSHGTRGQRQ
jgi:hypothetical protein